MGRKRNCPIDGEVIETTPEHPFYTDEGEWIAAGLLEIGDQIQKADGGGYSFKVGWT